MRIALDAMGGDHAPRVTVEGAIAAARETGLEIILVGQQDKLQEELSQYKTNNLPLSIHHAAEVIGMEESPAQAVRQKRDASLTVATRLVAEGKADAFVSAGNSGACMASSLLSLGRISGVSRPAIATIFPTVSGICVLLDVGANVDCKPRHLVQFAAMGAVYIQHVFGISNPRVGLLSIGEEEGKGNEQVLATYDLLKKSGLNFVGNVEGRDIPRGKADVVVCDGFTGNVVLKFGEGIVEMLAKLVREELKDHPVAWLSLPFLWAALKDLRKKVDYTEHGGAPLLGVNGVSIISHGRSNAKAIKNALLAARRVIETNVTRKIQDEIGRIELPKNGDSE